MESTAKPHVVVVVADEAGTGSGTGSGSGDERPRCSLYSSLSSSSSSSSSNEETSEIKERRSSHSSSVSEVVDLECGEGKVVNLAKVERDCRICHLSLDATNPESGVPIELGCSCKDDLAAAHKHCAEAWFKIKGNKTCEICGSTACNVVGANEVEMTEQWNESTETTPPATAAPVNQAEARNFWQGHRFLNFLLACMVFAFVISWLFHFNIPS